MPSEPPSSGYRRQLGGNVHMSRTTLGVGQGLGVVSDLAREGFGVDFEVLDKPILMVE